MHTQVTGQPESLARPFGMVVKTHAVRAWGARGAWGSGRSVCAGRAGQARTTMNACGHHKSEKKTALAHLPGLGMPSTHRIYANVLCYRACCLQPSLQPIPESESQVRAWGARSPGGSVFAVDAR